MSVDVVDQNGQDVFVSAKCRNYVSPERWDELKEALAIDY